MNVIFSNVFRVLKTIRLNMTEMQTFLSDLPAEGRISKTNFHVIYLTRDPRGIINSIKSLQEQWPDKLLEPNHICSRWVFNKSTCFQTKSKKYLLLHLLIKMWRYHAST